MAKSQTVDSNLLDHIGDNMERQAALAFGERLRARAIELTKNATEIAKAAGVKRGAMTGYWAGDRIPPANKLFAMADFLKLDARYLASGVRPPMAFRLVEAVEADWVEVTEYDLREMTDESLGVAVASGPIRRDWLYSTFRTTTELWLTRLLSDYTPADLAEDQLVVCRTVKREELAEGHICLWRVRDSVVIGRFSVVPDTLSGEQRSGGPFAAYVDPALGISTSELIIPPSRSGPEGPYHLIGRIMGVMMRPL